MSNNVTLEELQGAYDITYQSVPQLEGWYEPGVGACVITGNHLQGLDGVGAEWRADFAINDNGKITFSAVVDPRNALPNTGLLDRNGQMTREAQSYTGELKVTKNGTNIILRTSVQQGPITVNVQFLKRA